LEKTKIAITTEYIRLDQFIKFCGIVQTGGQAKELILKGMVFVNEEVCLQRGKKLRGGESVYLSGRCFEVIKNDC
jgi:ribosome-associated protein